MLEVDLGHIRAFYWAILMWGGSQLTLTVVYLQDTVVPPAGDQSQPSQPYECFCQVSLQFMKWSVWHGTPSYIPCQAD